MIKLRHKQTEKEWTYSATVWFSKKFDLSLYDILEWHDVVELFYDKNNKKSIGKMEKRDAIKKMDSAPYIDYWFEEIPNPTIKKENIKDRLLKRYENDLRPATSTKKDYTFVFLKILFEAGLNKRVNVTKFLEGYFPIEEFTEISILTQDDAILYFLNHLKSDNLIKFDTIRENDANGNLFISTWLVSITKDGIDFYLRVSEHLPTKTHAKTIPKSTTSNKLKNELMLYVVYPLIVGLMVATILKIMGII